MAWIAIDAGTSVIKAVAFSEDGTELALAREKTRVLHIKQNFSEQNMEEVWQAVCATVRQAAQDCGETIEGIVSTAQGDGCWLVDKSGRPLRNAVLWNDGRAHEIVEHWRAAGVIDAAFRISGSISFPGLPNAISAWLGQHEPATMREARWMLSCNGWIFFCMTGRFTAELSDASNPYANVKSGEYSSDLLRMYGREDDSRLLPPIAVATMGSASLQQSAAEKMGVPPGIPAIMAPYDIVATAYGCGAVSPGQACVILGTTVSPEVITTELDLTGEPAGTTIALGDGRVLRAMPTLTGCEAMEWTARLLGCRDLSDLGILAAEAEDLPNAPFFLPYLSPAGERAPFLSPDASGSLHGIKLTTSRGQVAHALHEGLSFVIRECFVAAASGNLNEIYVTGGGAQSDLWCAMIADVTGIRVLRSTGSEHGARGAFLFAMAMQRGEEIGAEVERLLFERRTFTPDTVRHRLYAERYEIWRRLRMNTALDWGLLRASQ
jgi:erythritol kinase (D-erythritol 1-phosphate-forming)